MVLSHLDLKRLPCISYYRNSMMYYPIFVCPSSPFLYKDKCKLLCLGVVSKSYCKTAKIENFKEAWFVQNLCIFIKKI